MNTFIISAMYRLVKALFDGDVVSNIKDLVEAALDFEMSGVEKKAAVMRELKEIGGDVGIAIAATSTVILSMAVDVVVAYLVSKGAK